MRKRTGILALLMIALAVFWMRPEKRSAGRNADAGSFILSAHAQTSNYGGVSITSFAANCVPIAPTASSLACGALSDNGTLVTSTEPIVVPDGTVNNYTVRFGSGAGFFGVSGSQVNMGVNGAAPRVGMGINNGIQIGGDGSYSWNANGATISGTGDVILKRRAAANMMMGAADLNGTPVAQTISVQNAITGTNLPGASAFTFAAPLGTGNGAGSSTQFQRSIMQASGTTAQTGAAAFVVCESKTLSNTSATVQALATIGLASNSAGGARGSITVTATDGTNFDSETQDFVVSYVNKATVGTVGTAAITASTAANNSGSATIGMTATFSGSTVSINATPVFTTIVPTTVTAYLELQNHGTGAVTCQ